MKRLFTSALSLSALFFCYTLTAAVNANSEVDFTLTLNTSEELDSKITFISEDEVDFITRSVSGSKTETVVQLRPGVKYALSVKTGFFVPMIQEFVISDGDSSVNFIHLDLEHLKDDSGKIIGEQTVMVVPSAQKEKTPSLSEKTEAILESVRTSSKLEMLNTFSKTKFYFTAADYRTKLQEEGKPLANFDENSIVEYLVSREAEVMTNESYEELIPSQQLGLLAIYTSETINDEVSNTESLSTPEEPPVAIMKASAFKSDKLFFTIQLGAFSKEIKNPVSEFKTSSVFTEGSDTGHFRYFSGVFNSYKDAKTQKANLIASGLEGVFIAAFRNGERVPLAEAVKASAISTELE